MLKSFSHDIQDFVETKFKCSAENEVVNALNEAHLLFRSNSISSEIRRSFLKKLEQNLRNAETQILSIFCDETGYPHERAKNEWERMLFQLNNYAEALNTQLNPKISSDNNFALVQLPIGVVGVFGASNFPFAYGILGGDTISAWIAGCPVIAKANPLNLRVSKELENCVHTSMIEMGMDTSWFFVIYEEGIDLGQCLVKHQYCAAVGFTGSFNAGNSIIQLANQRPNPIPVFAEMGSVNPVIFSNTGLSNLKEKAKQMLDSIFLGTGQMCTSPGILFVPEDLIDEFFSLLLLYSKSLGQRPFLHPNLKRKFQQQVIEHLIPNQCDYPINWEHPTLVVPCLLKIDGDRFLAETWRHEEVFGPFAYIVSYENTNQLKNLLEVLHGQLTLTYIGERNEEAYSLALNFAYKNAGRFIFNGVPTGVAVNEFMVHGGAWPASSDARFSAVGLHAINRFLKPFCIQNNSDFDQISTLFNQMN